MSTLATLTVKVIGDVSDFQKKMDSADKTTQSAMDNMKKAGLVLSATVTAPIVGMGLKSIDAASDLEESFNKVQVVFGESAGAINDFTSNAATSIGTTQQSALEAAGTFGNLFTAMGIGQQPAADMSTSLLTLAADLASFNNIDPSLVFEKLRAGLVGEVEPLRTLGVNLSAAAVGAKAFELGLTDAASATDVVTAELSPAIKAQAAYAIIMEQTTNAQGDFARTSDGLANSQRILKANIGDLAAQIGSYLLPFALQVVSVANEWIARFMALSPETQKIIGVILLLAAAIGPLLLILPFIVSGFTALGTILSVAGTLIGAVVGAISSLIAPILLVAGLVALLYVAWTQNWGGIQEKTAVVIQFLKNAISQFLANVKQWWNDNRDAIIAAAKTAWETAKSIVETVINIIRTIVETVLRMIENFWNQHGDSIMTIARFAWETIRNAIQTIINIVSGIVSSVLAAISAFWDAHGAAIMTAAESAWQFIQGIIETILSVIGSIIDAAAAAIEGDWTGFGENLRAAWDTAWNAIKDVLSKAWEAIKGIVADLIANVVSAFTETDWASIGTSIITGIANAISSGAQLLKEAAFKAAKAAYDAVLAFFKVGSPSRLMIELGENVVHGFEIPFLKTDRIESAAAKFAAAAVPAPRSALSSINDHSRETNFNIHTTTKYEPEQTLSEKLRLLTLSLP